MDKVEVLDVVLLDMVVKENLDFVNIIVSLDLVLSVSFKENFGGVLNEFVIVNGIDNVDFGFFMFVIILVDKDVDVKGKLIVSEVIGVVIWEVVVGVKEDIGE